MTGSQSDADPDSPKPRGLWSLMGAGAATPPPDSEVSAEQTPAAAPLDAESPHDQVEPSGPSPRNRGLWGMMQPSEPITTDLPAGSERVKESESTADLPPTQIESPRNSEAKGLFALMQRKTEEVSAAEIDDLLETLDQNQGVDELHSGPDRRVGVTAMWTDSSPGETNQDDQFDESDSETAEVSAEEIDELLEGLDDDGRSSDDHGRPLGRRAAARTPVVELPGDEVADATAPVPTRSLPPMNVIELDQLDELEPVRYRQADDKTHRQCWMGLACGAVSVAGSALAMLPQFWSSFPATILGFVAIIAGYALLTGSGRRQIPSTARAACLAGMFLGAAGILLGPLLFANWGRYLRESTGQPVTLRHLAQIGGAIDGYYGENDGFPIGGTFVRNEAGVIKGQHGWMTALLPFVGESELYHRIDQTLPFDDAANRAAMGRDVIPYFAAGGDRSKFGQGFAVSHFAGLGGEINNASGLSHVGIFERDVAVKKDEITDGLSSTLIVGELAGGYPPWGDPENWRKIGRGLNKDPNGFGSAQGHGATFLLADGSVRFFNNRTDPKLLERLSTRDGSE